MAERKRRFGSSVKFRRARRAVPFLLLLAGLLGVTPLAWGQYASKTGDVVGTVGGACTSSANTYGWPDTNGDILKCVSNVWTLVTQPSTAAGSTGYVQFNNANALAADSNLFWDNTNKRLGIGNTAPGYQLQVGNSTDSVDMAGPTRQIGITYGGTYEPVAQLTAGNTLQFGGGGHLYALYMGMSTPQNGIWINNSNRVGINYSGYSLSEKFNVNGNIVIGVDDNSNNAAGNWYLRAGNASDAYATQSGGTLIVQSGHSSGNNNSGVNLQLAGGASTGNATGGSILFQVSPPGASGYTVNTATTVMTITGAGNVGIGTTVPAYLLHVGSASASGIVAEFQNSAGNCTFAPITSTWSCSSDIRLKKDIQDSGAALPDLQDMRIRDFTLRATDERRTGVIAQEILKAHPDMVHMGKDGFFTVDEPNPWKLVKAIQELKAENDNLADSLKAANDNIADLRAFFEAYKKAHP